MDILVRWSASLGEGGGGGLQMLKADKACSCMVHCIVVVAAPDWQSKSSTRCVVHSQQGRANSVQGTILMSALLYCKWAHLFWLSCVALAGKLIGSVKKQKRWELTLHVRNCGLPSDDLARRDRSLLEANLTFGVRTVGSSIAADSTDPHLCPIPVLGDNTREVLRSQRRQNGLPLQ